MIGSRLSVPGKIKLLAFILDLKVEHGLASDDDLRLLNVMKGIG